MKSLIKLIVFLAVLAALAIPGPAQAAATDPDKVVFGGTYTLASGETLDGNLAVFGGTATIEQNSRVTGDIVLTGGALNVDGEVDKSISALGGSLFLNDHAIIHGDINMLGATIQRSPNARVDGKIVNSSNAPLQFDLPGKVFAPNLNDALKPITDTLWLLFRSLAMAALAILTVLFLPVATNRVAQAVVSQPVMSGALGLLTLIVAPIALVLVGITIILLPVSLLGLLVVAVAIMFGWIALGMEVGKRLLGLFHADWPLPLAAGAGTFIMTLVVTWIGSIPCVGWLIPFIVVLLGLGGIVLSRFGTQDYTGTGMLVSTPPAPAAPSNPVPPEDAGPTNPGIH